MAVRLRPPEGDLRLRGDRSRPGAPRRGRPAAARQNRERLKIESVFWYTWLSADKDLKYPFDFAGLSAPQQDGKRVIRKPAYDAFARIALGLEGCVTKTTDARVCAS